MCELLGKRFSAQLIVPSRKRPLIHAFDLLTARLVEASSEPLSTVTPYLSKQLGRFRWNPSFLHQISLLHYRRQIKSSARYGELPLQWELTSSIAASFSGVSGPGLFPSASSLFWASISNSFCFRYWAANEVYLTCSNSASSLTLCWFSLLNQRGRNKAPEWRYR